MEAAQRDQYVVYVLSSNTSSGLPEDAERETASCETYEEARRIWRHHRAESLNCVIRFTGDVGGGD